MMELTCPRCGATNESDDSDATGAQVTTCASCGANLRGMSDEVANARRAREYDGYVVGRRVLRIAPVWLLLSIAGFVLALLFFSWASRPIGKNGNSPGEDFKNEAMNQAPAPVRDARPVGTDLKTPTASPANGQAGFETAMPAGSYEPAAQGETDEEEASVFSVQVGAFADLSQANEQVSRLRAAGFEARVVESGTTTRFRFQVRSGRFDKREEAAHLAAQLRAGGVAAQTIIIEPLKK
jgi:cell division septation protein DedD